MRQLKLHRVILATFLGLVAFVLFPIRFFSDTSVYSQENSSFQMNTKDVLAIIARPLPPDISQGFYLPKVNLRNANLVGVDFAFSLLSYSDLSGALLVNANFSNASLQEVNLAGAELSNADLSNAWLFGSNLENTTVAYSTLDNANLEDANLLSCKDKVGVGSS
jgi:hypothetical protein